jgi:hypothetical protein
MPDRSPLSGLELGPLDAETDPNFEQYSVDHDLLSELVAGRLVLVTAPKGYGKSALARLAKTRLNDSLLLINQSKGFDVEQLETKSSSEIRRKFSAFLIAFLISHLKSIDKLDKTISETILESKTYNAMKKLFSAVKVKPPFVEVALEDIFPKSKAKNVAELLSEDTCTSLKKSIGKTRIYIVIDDSDSFASTSSDDQQKLFLRELIMAAHDVSHLKLRNSASIIVLLKEEVLNRIRNGFEEFDKVREY